MSITPLRRAVDLAFGITGLVLFGGPIAAMMLIARLETGKSGLFLQTRYGLHGKPFTIYKIRSLDGNLHPLPVSGIFRKIGIDELPQCINLIRGDMSLIGPRPDMEIQQVQGWMHMLDIPPGLTGLNSVLEKEARVLHSPERRVEIETDYVDLRTSHRSLPTDIGIVFRTAKLIFTGRVDYGKPPIATADTRQRLLSTEPFYKVEP